MPHLILIDASGYLFRAYHALPGFSNPQGQPVGAVYGFVSMLMKLREKHASDYVAVVFDADRKTFRSDIYAEYKAHRPPPPEDLVPQFALVREATAALGFKGVELQGFEADDLIAAYARDAKARGVEVTIFSSDKDLMQLIGEGVGMFDPMKQKPIGPEQVIEKFGVGPEKVADVLALIGDTSDNVPGVPGIGPKTAAELIKQFGDVETLLARADEIPQVKRREGIQQHVEQARLSKQLVLLDANAPLPEPLDAFALPEPDAGKLRTFLEAQGFKSLVARLGKAGSGDLGVGIQGSGGLREKEVVVSSSPNPQSQIPASYELIQDEAALMAWIDKAARAGHVAFDTETDALDATKANLIGFSLCVEAGKACYVPVGHRGAGIGNSGDRGGDLFTSPNPPSPAPRQIPLARAIELITPLLEDDAVLKIGHNVKYDAQVMRRYGVEVAPVDDTMLLSYVLSAGLHAQNMDELAERVLGVKTITYDEVTGTGKARVSFAEVPLERARDYAAEDAEVTLRLHQALKPRVFSQHLLSLYETIERPLIPVIVAMEAAGVKIDMQALAQLSRDFTRRMGELEEEIHAIAGQPFNIGSPKQLGEILFDVLKLPGGKKSAKTGAYSTDIQVLEELSEEGHALPAKIIEWRQLSKLKGTYADALPAQVHPQTGRVHTSFSMATTLTGRLSSSDPNLQNIPIRTIEGKKIRSAFVAAPGNVLISADYSQIELRLLAHVAGIRTLIDAFRHGDDIHAITASQMFGVPVQEVNADLRRKAKTINFGIIYGISAHGLAVRLGIGRPEAAAYIEQYFRQYPGIRDYMEMRKAEAREKGYVTTLFGRRCHIPAINEKHMGRRQGAERQAINAPLQGTAADIIKRAMIAVHAALMTSALPVRMVLQVHDELVFEAAKGAAEAAIALIRPAMEHAAHLSVPLVVEARAGRSWEEAH